MSNNVKNLKIIRDDFDIIKKGENFPWAYILYILHMLIILYFSSMIVHDLN